MEAHLSTDGNGQLYYETPLLRITVLGGIKLEGLDRLRVTLEFNVPESPRPAIRHNIDLYNDNAVGKLVRSVAARLEVGMSVTEAHIEAVTQGLQAWRLEELKKQGEEQVKEIPLTEEQESEARADLQGPQLLQWTGERLGESGIVGEGKNRLILFVVMTSRLLRDPLSAVCMARSGVGKSHLMEKVAQCMPEPSKLECTTLTPEALYYMGRYELSHRILLIEDLEGAKGVMYPIRELQTRKRLSKSFTEKDRSGKAHTVQRIVEGPVSVVACTTAEAIYEDNANRSLPLHLDDSAEQDARIMEHQRALVAGLIDAGEQQRIRERLQRMQRVLRPVKVVNPYAPLIALPAEVFKPRRTLQLLLSFIEAVTFYHQYQREEKVDANTGEVYIETSVEDVETAFALLSDTLFRKSDELSGACRATLEWIRTHYVTPSGAEAFTAQGIRRAIGHNPRTLRHHLQELADYGYIERDAKKKHSTGHVYSVPMGADNGLSRSIQQQIEAVLRRISEERVKEVGRSAKVGNGTSCQPTDLGTKEKKRLARSAIEKIKRDEKVAPE